LFVGRYPSLSILTLATTKGGHGMYSETSDPKIARLRTIYGLLGQAHDELRKLLRESQNSPLCRVLGVMSGQIEMLEFALFGLVQASRAASAPGVDTQQGQG
jgi:hypothetical protein